MYLTSVIFCVDSSISRSFYDHVGKTPFRIICLVIKQFRKVERKAKLNYS